MFSEIKEQLKVGLHENESTHDYVVAVYLFGSSLQKESHKADSDIDLAFLLRAEVYDADPLDAVIPAYMAAASLGMCLGRETDVTILNSASLEIAYEIVTTGKCLLDYEPDKRLDYEIALRGMYFDFMPFIQELRKGCLRILKG